MSIWMIWFIQCVQLAGLLHSKIGNPSQGSIPSLRERQVLCWDLRILSYTGRYYYYIAGDLGEIPLKQKECFWHYNSCGLLPCKWKKAKVIELSFHFGAGTLLQQKTGNTFHYVQDTKESRQDLKLIRLVAHENLSNSLTCPQTLVCFLVSFKSKLPSSMF